MSTGTMARMLAAALWVAAVAAVPVDHGAADDAGADATKRELQERIAELEAKSARDDARNAELEARLSALEAGQSEGWLTHQRAQEIRALVADVLADADTRASRLGAITAGYDDGFVLMSADGNWLLRTNLLMQQRLVINEQSNSPNDDSRWGFENSRTKFILSGHFIQPDWFYRLEIEVGRVNDDLPSGEDRTGLGDAFAGYDFGQGWRLLIGTFKAPLLREELVESAYQLAVERSVVNYLFTGGRTDGIVASYRNAHFHLAGSYNNGIDDAVFGGGVTAGGTSPITTPTADYALTLRGEWLLRGAWDSLTEFTSPPGGEPALMAGAAVHYQSARQEATGVPDLDLLLATLDFSGQFAGASVFASLIYANADRDLAPTADAFGLVIQAGYYFDARFEVFARYEWGDTDSLTFSDINILTIGFNRYLTGQNAKWSTDFGLGFDPAPVTVPIAAWRADSPGENHQVVVRSQLQILF